MADRYTKISHQKDYSVNDISGEFTGQVLAVDGTLTAIGSLAKYIIHNCDLADNTFQVTFLPGMGTIHFESEFFDNDRQYWLYCNENGDTTYWEPCSTSGINEAYINIRSRIINYATISCCSWDDDKKTENVFKSLRFLESRASAIKLKDTTLESLTIENCPGLTTCILGNFNAIKNISITDTDCYNNIRINKLSGSDFEMLNMENNNFSHIEIHGDGETTLNANNCKILNQKNYKKLQSVCFIDCNVDTDFLKYLSDNSVKIYNLKKEG